MKFDVQVANFVADDKLYGVCIVGDNYECDGVFVSSVVNNVYLVVRSPNGTVVNSYMSFRRNLKEQVVQAVQTNYQAAVENDLKLLTLMLADTKRYLDNNF